MDPRLEAIMAGLFGGQDAGGAQGLGNIAPAADTDPRRRRAGAGSGYGGIGGGEVTISQMLPYLRGMPQYDYSGPMRGQGGLAGLLSPDFGTQGPSARHLQRQGGFEGLPPGMQGRPELPPGIEQQFGPGALGGEYGSLNPVGGPNIAPGNIDGGLALGQAGRGPAGGMHTQGWRNVAPGYSATAQLGYGTPEFDRAIQGGAGRGPAGGAGPIAPGAAGGVGGGGGQAKAVGGGGAGAAAPAAGGASSGSVRPSGGGRGGRNVGAPGGGMPGGARPASEAQGGGGRRAGGRPVGGGNVDYTPETRPFGQNVGPEGRHPNQNPTTKSPNKNTIQTRNQNTTRPGSVTSSPPSPEPVTVQARESTKPPKPGKTKPKPKPKPPGQAGRAGRT